MHKGVSFVVTVSSEAAAFLTDPAQDLATRAGCLAELVEAGQARAGGSRVRRGERAVKVLAVVPAELAYQLLADEPRHRRYQLARVVTCESFLFCGASRQLLTRPPSHIVACPSPPCTRLRRR